MKKRILLTGATGFIGYNLFLNLYKKYDLLVLIRRKNNSLKRIIDKNKIKFIYYKSPSQLNYALKKRKIDFVIHCATHYCKHHDFKDILKMSDSNIVLGNIILENRKNLNFKKFINFTTIWENFDGIKNNPANLYATYKQSFSRILNYYKNQKFETKFYNIFLSETFGKNDKRVKLINVLKTNYKKNLISKIVSKNLFLNLLNIEDITKAVNLLLNKKIKQGDYVIKNNSNIKILKLINLINKKTKKIKVRWLSNKIIKEKIFNYNKLPHWKPTKSKMKNISEFITN